HIMFSVSYVALCVRARIRGFDWTLEEAAMDLGAPPLKTFLVITLPLIAPALVGGWLLAFSLSLDDLVIASFTTGPGATTLPMRIYSQMRLGVTPEINAISSILVGIVVAGLTIAALVQGRYAARRAPR
ncbi:MAG: ABC transporter permease, partial [Geminicoccaceae bacterium]